jgi:cyanophycin synthetase
MRNVKQMLSTDAGTRRRVELLRRAQGRAEPAAPAPKFLRIQQMRHVPGFLHGLRAPSVEARLAVMPWSGWVHLASRGLTLLEEQLPAAAGARMPELATAPRRSPSAGILHRLVRVVHGLQQAAGLPHLGDAWLVASPAPKDKAAKSEQWTLAVPGLAPAAVAEALAWVVQWLDRRSPEAMQWSARDGEQLAALLAGMGRSGARGFNNRYLLEAAHAQGIPWQALPGGVFQYGWGERSAWMESTFTQATSSISSKAARNKAVTAAMLRQAGLPAPVHRIVRTEEAAIEAATAIGYPVVVKPLDQDGGVGVSAGLQDEAQVRSAFARARTHAENLLVEKHVDGRDFRVWVFNGKAVGAMERVPGGVTGDGVHSVQELVAIANRDPLRGHQDWSVLSALELDEEALELLAAGGIDPASVPAAGRFVRLRRAANISSGGTPVDVFAQLHPDNARLCERAAAALRLDLAGIDLIIPDIAKSWRETGAGICEVNAQPQISAVAAAHLFPQVLSRLVRAKGRIPVALVVGAADAGASVVGGVAAMLARRGVRAGAVGEGGVMAGEDCLSPTRGALLADVRCLLLDQGVQALVVHAEAKDLVTGGFPFDRFDVLAVAEGVGAELTTLFGQAALHCSGDVLMPHDHPAVAAAREAFGAQRVQMLASPAALPAALDAALQVALRV